MADDERRVHIHIGDDIGHDKAGGDHMAAGDVAGTGVAIGRYAGAGDGGRRRMEENDVVIALLTELRSQMWAVQGRLTALESEVRHLSDRARPTPWNTNQWLFLIAILAVAAGVAVWATVGVR